MKKYYPILLSKAGELTALSELTLNVKNEITPIIEVLPDNVGSLHKKLVENWAFEGNEIYLDFSLYTPYDKQIKTLILNLSTGGVNVVPLVQTNSEARYLALLQNLIAQRAITHVCIRVSNFSGGFLNVNGQVATLLGNLGITRNRSSILIDLGFVDQNNYNAVSALAVNLITGINRKEDYRQIIVASGSFLENLSALTPPGRLYRLQRFEWDIWLAIQQDQHIADLVRYGDYGTKYPIFKDVNYVGSCSIKYTLESEFLVYRGEISKNHRDGNGQYITFADRLVRSVDYSGAAFSWGDGQIEFYANQSLTDPKRKTGNAKTWVEISQNHHITLLHSLL